MPSATQMSQGYWAKHPRVNFAIAFFCLALIVIVWGMAIDRVKFERARTIADAVRENSNLASALENDTIRTLKTVDAIMLFVSYEYEHLGAKLNIAKYIDRYIAEGIIDDKLFNLVSVIDARGDVVASSRTLQAMNVADREYFKVHLQQDSGKLVIGKPVLDRMSQKWSIQMTRWINNPDGSFRGVVSVAVDPGHFADLYRKADRGLQGAVCFAI